MKAAPSRNDPTNLGLLYDSLVDNVQYPGAFVVFLDHQCCPGYITIFTKPGPE